MPPFSDSRVCAEMETMAELNINVWPLLLCSLEFSEVRQNLRLSSFIVPENGCGSSPDGSKGRAAAGQWRKQCPSRFSAVGGRTLPSYHSSPAGREIFRKQILSLINHLQMFGGGCTLRKGAFLAGPAVRRKSSLRSMSSSRKTSSAGPRRTSTRTLNM